MPEIHGGDAGEVSNGDEGLHKTMKLVKENCTNWYTYR
jgi:hypothetical protein